MKTKKQVNHTYNYPIEFWSFSSAHFRALWKQLVKFIGSNCHWLGLRASTWLQWYWVLPKCLSLSQVCWVAFTICVRPFFTICARGSPCILLWRMMMIFRIVKLAVNHIANLDIMLIHEVWRGFSQFSTSFFPCSVAHPSLEIKSSCFCPSCLTF